MMKIKQINTQLQKISKIIFSDLFLQVQKKIHLLPHLLQQPPLTLFKIKQKDKFKIRIIKIKCIIPQGKMKINNNYKKKIIKTKKVKMK